jgi:hypothetical protein
MSSNILSASLGVFYALNKRTDAPIFSRPYYEADTLLEMELKRLSSILGDKASHLDKSGLIQYAVQVCRYSQR